MAVIKDLLWFTQIERSTRGWRSHVELAGEDIGAGAQGILMTERNFSQEEFLETALKVKAVCDEARVPLWIRDNVVVAFVASATGVVVSMPGLAGARRVVSGAGLVAVEVESDTAREAAFRAGADRVMMAGDKIQAGSGLILPSQVKVFACMGQ